MYLKHFVPLTPGAHPWEAVSYERPQKYSISAKNRVFAEISAKKFRPGGVRRAPKIFFELQI